eukprot:4363301-Lingulodinium_polyedra.AAC.1
MHRTSWARSPRSPRTGLSPVIARPPVAARMALRESALKETGQEQWPMAQATAQARADFSARSAPPPSRAPAMGWLSSVPEAEPR